VPKIIALWEPAAILVISAIAMGVADVSQRLDRDDSAKAVDSAKSAVLCYDCLRYYDPAVGHVCK
jgi:hypothetical protein